MSRYQFARLIRPGLSRLGAVFLALAVLLPGRWLQAAVPMRSRPAPPRRGRSGPAVNQAPVATDDNLVAFAGEEDQPLLVLANDTDPDAGDVLNIFSVSVLPQHGTITWRALDFLMYAPDPGFTGVDTFKYVVEDRPQFTGGLTDTGSVSVTVVAPGAAGTTSSAFAVNSCLPDVSGCDTSFWRVNPNSGASALSNSGACNGASGLGIQDAYSWNYELDKAFDTGLTLWINGQQLTPRLPMTVTHYSLVSGPVTLSNVRVTVHYDGLVASDTLRTDVILDNESGATRNITVTLASNVGTDGATIIAGSSDGNTNFTTADRWLVTSKSGGAPFKLVDTHVLFGSGATITPTAVFTTTFKCNETPTPNGRGVRANFHLSIPTGHIQRLLFFNQIHQTGAAALSDAAIFNAEPVGLLAGLTNDQLHEVVNWQLNDILHLDLPLVVR